MATAGEGQIEGPGEKGFSFVAPGQFEVKKDAATRRG